MGAPRREFPISFPDISETDCVIDIIAVWLKVLGTACKMCLQSFTVTGTDQFQHGMLLCIQPRDDTLAGESGMEAEPLLAAQTEPCGDRVLPSASRAGVWDGSLGPCSALWSHRGGAVGRGAGFLLGCGRRRVDIARKVFQS